MKKSFIISLGLMLLVLVFTSCSVITGGEAGNNEEVYKDTIQRYYNAILKLDTDNFLDSLDPLGPIYPTAEFIKHLREEAANGAYPGEFVVKELTILEESATRAKVKVTIYMNVDFSRSDKFQEQTFSAMFELTYKDGVWRVFNGTGEA